MAEVSLQLATYTGLVEAARANNVQGFPIGSAYLREASSSMQTKVLPGAEKVYAADLGRVDQAQRRVGSLPIAGLALLALALAAIGVGSAVMYKRTNRTFNLGLVAAAVVVVLVMVWIVGAVRLAAGDIERGRTEGTARFGQLAQARILAQQARTDETLQLINRGDITASEKSFYGHIDDLRAGSGPPRPQRRRPSRSGSPATVSRWTPTAHGDYLAAVAQALGTDTGESGAQFAVVESSLRDAIEQARATMRAYVSDAGALPCVDPRRRRLS